MYRKVLTMDKDRVQQQVKKQAVRKTKRTAKKKIKRIHPLSFVVWFLALAIGLAVGAGACAFLCRNDGFELIGKSEIYVPVEEGKVYDYTDKGVRAVSLGKDISRRVKVKTNMAELGDGEYSFDASKAGVYYLIYTVDDARYGNVQRVRTIIVGGDS